MLLDSKASCRFEIMLPIDVQVQREVGRHGDSHKCTSVFSFEWPSWLAVPISGHFRTTPSPHQHWCCCCDRKVELPEPESDISSLDADQ
jgi:hypothetical protein